MRKNAGLMIITLLLLVVPALANAWTLTVKVAGGSDANNVKVVYGSTTKVLKNGTSYLYPTSAATITFQGAVPTTATLDGFANPGPISLSSGSHTVAATYAAAATTGFTIAQNTGGVIYAQNLNNTWTTTGVSGLTAGTVLPVTIAADANHKIVNYSLDGAAAITTGVTGAAGQVLSLSAAAGGQTITATYGVAGKVTANLFAPTNGTTTKAVYCSTTATSNDTGLQYAFAVTGPASFNQAASSTATFSFTPAVVGTYTVTATVTTANGGSTTASANIKIADFLETANTGCVSCHSTSTPAVITGYNNGTHGNSTVTCQGCHDGAKSHGSAKSTVSIKSATTAAIYEAGQSTATVPKASGYVGAAACQSCHADTYATWSKTIHNKPLKSIANQTDSIFVNKIAINTTQANDFKMGINFNYYNNDGTVNAAGTAAGITTALGTTHTFATRQPNAPILSYSNGHYYIQIGVVKYEIFRTQGGNGKWKQRYHTKIGNAYYVLNVQFNEANKAYEEYNGANWYSAGSTAIITAGISDADPLTVAQVQDKLLSRNVPAGDGPSASSWDNRCAACHQTGVSVEFKDVGLGKPEVISSSADLNIGCESCHGAGASHVAGPTATNIKNPKNWATNVGSNNYYRANEVCGQCHSRVEGFAHFSSSVGKVKKGIEAPSKVDEFATAKVIAESYNIGEAVLGFMEQIIPGTFKANGTSGNNGTLAYDGGNRMINFQAADKHHQQWHDMEMGAHGAVAQMSSNKGLTCFSCHDAHNPNSGNIRASIKVGEVAVPTASTDNTLCLACHAGNAGSAFVALTATDIATAPQGDAVQNAVYDHLIAKAGYSEAKRASWKTKYLTSVQANGTTPATFGNSIYKVGQCISCHMPFSAKSGIRVGTNANGRSQGDIRNHTMKTLWPGLTGLTAAKGLTSTTTITSCSACHAVAL